MYYLVILTLIFALPSLWRFTKNKYQEIYRKEIEFRKRKGKGVGFIYFYRGRGEITNLFLIKIGRTNNMKQRMSSAKTSNPFGIDLLAVVMVKSDVFAESFIHRKFKRFRISKKNEWFWFLPVWFYMICVRDNKLTKRIKEMI